MVREVQIERSFQDCTPQEFFEAVYDNDIALKIYHKLNSSAEGAEITPWLDKERIVTFYKEIQLPSALTYLFSSNKIPIKEVQRLDHYEDHTFTISSCPEVQIQLGPKFTTTLKLTVLATTEGCMAQAKVICEASGPWGLISTIETFMETEAKQNVDKFLMFCETRISDWKIEQVCDVQSEPNSAETPFQDVVYDSISQFSFPEPHTVENRDPVGMLTTNNVLIRRIESIEAELKASRNEKKMLLEKVGSLETSLLQGYRTTTMAIMACSTISVVCILAVTFLNRQRS